MSDYRDPMEMVVGDAEARLAAVKASYEAENAALRARVAELEAAAPSEPVAFDPVEHEAQQWRKLEMMGLAVRQGDADENEVVRWMWEQLGVTLKRTRPAALESLLRQP